jgi:hypothetical protein
MKYLPIISALSVAILCILIAAPPSVYSKVACVALGLALLYFGYRATAGRASGVPANEPEGPLDHNLVASIHDNLRREPSEQLREMLAQSSGRKWSPEALHAARLLLDQRSNNLAPEPAYRTVPRAEEDQSSREREAVAPRFSRQLLALDVGSRVYCRWRGETGTIIRWQDEEERFYIRYENGEGEWATLGMFE